jgi:hypothetical protein
MATAIIDRYGLKQGDRVGICMRNYPEWPMAYVAATSVGCVAVGMNSMWKEKELECVTQHAQLWLSRTWTLERSGSACFFYISLVHSLAHFTSLHFTHSPHFRIHSRHITHQLTRSLSDAQTPLTHSLHSLCHPLTSLTCLLSLSLSRSLTSLTRSLHSLWYPLASLTHLLTHSLTSLTRSTHFLIYSLHSLTCSLAHSHVSLQVRASRLWIKALVL